MKILERFRVIPVLVVPEVKNGLKMCELLCENNLPVAEITFRTSAATAVIIEAKKRFPELCLGAGTVLDVETLKRALDAGAAFAVAPGFNSTVVKAALKMKYSFAPGICTPSEIEQAYELGCRFFKFFPAEAAGGVNMLKSIIAPYKHLGIKFMPTGGVTPANAAEYLSIPEVSCIGGTWLGKDIPDWNKVKATVIEAAKI